MKEQAHRQLNAVVVKSGTWLYDHSVPSEVWIVKQNFEYHFEEDYAGEPEKLNGNGECFSVVIARNGEKIGRGSEELSLEHAVASAESLVSGLVWDDHMLGKLYGGRMHSRMP